MEDALSRSPLTFSKTIAIDSDPSHIDWRRIQAQIAMHLEDHGVWCLDLSRLPAITSGCVGQLMRLHSIARALGSRLVVKTAPDCETTRVLRMFKLIGGLELEA